ncbi:MAG: protease pro-enzyme activation domain-containing protein [Steroidobacteraceae bacterium]
MIGKGSNKKHSAAPRRGTRKLGPCLLAMGIALGAWLLGPASAQTSAARAQISAPIDDTQLIRLAGNTRPEANPANDRGRVSDTLAMEHMQLLLKRPAEREAALQKTIEDLHDRVSPNFHHWLNVEQIRQRYGLAQADLDAISDWLRRQGFAVNAVSPSTMIIDFSGTAGQVRGAFHTEIHTLEVAGKRHIANISDPQVPAALAPAVSGVVSLHDFGRTRTSSRERTRR